MFKEMFDRVWAFDAEWVPDQLAGRLLYDVDDEAATEREIIERMWKEGGATEEDPMPFLKMVACRVVSIAVLERWKSPRSEERRVGKACIRPVRLCDTNQEMDCEVGRDDAAHR